ncbi:MAG: S1C family serine protease [Pirellulaceae bacterium]
MRPSGPFPFPRRHAGDRPVRSSWATWLCLVGLVLVSTASPATAKEAEPTLPAALERIFAEGVPTSLVDLRLMDAHQRTLIERLTQVTVGIEIDQTQGSGVIISPDGLILTAAHVAGAPNRTVRVWTSDGQQHRGKTLGMNKGMDAGLIKITPSSTETEQETSQAKPHWPHAVMGDTSRLHAGSWCLALGHPGGYQLDRQPSARFGRVLSVNNTVIETDCLLIGGDSGGPLFDMHGQVVGIHSRIGRELNKNMHVPVHTYRDNWDRLVRGESWGTLLSLVGRPVIGVLGDRNTDVPRIAQVLPASPAESAGLQAGDLVLRFGEDEVRKFDDLKQLVGRRNPGDEVALRVLRGEETLEFLLIIGSLPGDATPPSPTGDDQLSKLPGIVVPTRAASEYSRNHASVLLAFRDAVAPVGKCTVQVLCDNEQIALGTIVDSNGFIATKGSELHGAVICRLADGRRYPAEVMGVDRGSDLAVLKIAASGLPAIAWREEEPPVAGSWVATPGVGELPQAGGIVSVAPHPVRGGVLGVQLAEDKPGPRIVFLVPGSGAAKAGLLRGDVITHIDGRTVDSSSVLVAATSAMMPGETATLTVLRNNETLQLSAVLSSLADTLSTNHAKVQESLGGPLSARRVLFPSVLEHDSILQPNQCGGPLVDLNGQVVGINIARANRVATYAIPARVARPLLESLQIRTPTAVSSAVSTEALGN